LKIYFHIRQVSFLFVKTVKCKRGKKLLGYSVDIAYKNKTYSILPNHPLSTSAFGRAKIPLPQIVPTINTTAIVTDKPLFESFWKKYLNHSIKIIFIYFLFAASRV